MIITLGDASTRMGIVYTVDPVNFSVALLKVRPRIRPPLRATAASLPNNHSVLVRCLPPPRAPRPRRPTHPRRSPRLTRAPPQFNPISNPIQSSRNAAATSVNQRPTRERDQPGERPADRRPRTRHPRRRGGRRQPARDGSADEEVVRRGSTGVVPRRGGVPARAVRGRRRGRGGTKRRGRARRGVGGERRTRKTSAGPHAGSESSLLPLAAATSSRRFRRRGEGSRRTSAGCPPGRGANGGNGAAVYPPVGGTLC